MINKKKAWQFIRQPGARPTLTEKEVSYWKNILGRLSKAGIELEYNLPETNGTCNKTNLLCQCVAIFNAKEPMPKTTKCFEQCERWDKKFPEDGNCQIAKKYGCAGINCSEFVSPCPKCKLYDRGCENCTDLYRPLSDPNNIRAELTARLDPSQFVGDFGKKGVLKVIKDGSLKGDGGVEIITVGTRVQFKRLQSMLAGIIKEAMSVGAWTNERCSSHIHLLASYLTPNFDPKVSGKILLKDISEMEMAMPELILANFHQLIRRYHVALVWMGMSGQKMETLTRWEKFRKSVLPYSPISHRMSSVVAEIKESVAEGISKGRYSFINYSNMAFDDKGDISQLHLEARYLDGMFSPSVIAAHACLLYGLLIKAVDLSAYGLLRAGDAEYMDQQKNVMKLLCNNNFGEDFGENRNSDTKGVHPYIPWIKEQAKELVLLLKGPLSNEMEALSVLEKLVEKPVSFWLIEGKSWKQIEEIYAKGTGETEKDIDLGVILSTTAIHGCDSPEEWIAAATGIILEEAGATNDARLVEATNKRINAQIAAMREKGKVFWSSAVGTYISG